MARWLRRLTGPRGLALWFLLCGLPTGLGCALLTPVGMFPDEFAHAARADGLRHGEIFGARPPPQLAGYMINAGVVVDNGIYAVLFSREYRESFPDKAVPAEARAEAEALPWFAGRTYYPTQMVEYFPVMYVPGAAGLYLGQALGLSPLDSYYAGRVAMVLAYLALGAAAIFLARFGNALLFAILLLPTEINLAGSFNQDGLITACCALAAALLSRARPGFSPAWFAALALLTAVVSAKTPYAPFLLLCLAPVFARGVWPRAAVVALACVLPGLWLLHVAHAGFMPYQRPPYHPGRLWPGPDMVLTTVQPRQNLAVLLAHPLQILLLPLHSFAHAWRSAWPRLLGMTSCDDLLLPGWVLLPLAVALLAAAASAMAPVAARWRGWDVALVAVALFGAFIGVELSMYLTFTRTGLGWVEGVQPRYFLPLLPFFIFLLPAAGGVLRLPSAGAAYGWACVPALAVAGAEIWAFPAFLFHLFRMAGP